jgi:acyl dehydratase
MDKMLRFKDLPYGKEFPQTSEVLTEELIQTFAKAIETDNPIHLDRKEAIKSAFGDLVAPPIMAYLVFRRSYLANHTMPGGGIGLKIEFEFLRAAKVGDHLHTVTRVTESVEREGKKFITLEGITKNNLNETVYLSRLRALWPE